MPAPVASAAIDTVPTPIVGPVIVVVTLNYYGSGATLDAALAECKRAGGARSLKSHGYVAHQLPANICEWSVGEVSGNLSWSWANAEAAPPKGSPERQAVLVADKRTARAMRGGR